MPQYLTSVRSNLAKGRIAVLSLLAAANAFVLRVRWTGTYARSGRRTMHNALMHGYVTHVSLKVPLPVGESRVWPLSNIAFFA